MSSWYGNSKREISKPSTIWFKSIRTGYTGSPALGLETEIRRRMRPRRFSCALSRDFVVSALALLLHLVYRTAKHVCSEYNRKQVFEDLDESTQVFGNRPDLKLNQSRSPRDPEQS